jgi:hypothetical protein
VGAAVAFAEGVRVVEAGGGGGHAPGKVAGIGYVPVVIADRGQGDVEGGVDVGVVGEEFRFVGDEVVLLGVDDAVLSGPLVNVLEQVVVDRFDVVLVEGPLYDGDAGGEFSVAQGRCCFFRTARAFPRR